MLKILFVSAKDPERFIFFSNVMGIKEGVRLWQIMAKGNQMVKLF